jgi:predicted secreted protein
MTSLAAKVRLHYQKAQDHWLCVVWTEGFESLPLSLKTQQDQTAVPQCSVTGPPAGSLPGDLIQEGASSLLQSFLSFLRGNFLSCVFLGY